jgi:hypothetical protein
MTDPEITEAVDAAVQSIADRLIRLGVERAASLVATADPLGPSVPPAVPTARERRSLPKSSRTAPGTDSLDRMILRLVRLHPGESMSQVYRRGRFPVSYSSVQMRAGWLKSCGLLRTEGATSQAKWYLVDLAPDDQSAAWSKAQETPTTESAEAPEPRVADVEYTPTPDPVTQVRAYLEAHPEGVPPSDLLGAISGLTRGDAVRLCSSLVARGTIRASQARGLTTYTLGGES